MRIPNVELCNLSVCDIDIQIMLGHMQYRVAGSKIPPLSLFYFLTPRPMPRLRPSATVPPPSSRAASPTQSQTLSMRYSHRCHRRPAASRGDIMKR